MKWSTQAIAKLGENIAMRRFVRFKVGESRRRIGGAGNRLRRPRRKLDASFTQAHFSVPVSPGRLFLPATSSLCAPERARYASKLSA